MVLGGCCLKIKDVCMDFEQYFKVPNLVSVHPKSVILGQMTNLSMVFHMVVSVYRLIKILKLAPVPWWVSEQLIVANLKPQIDILIWTHEKRRLFTRGWEALWEVYRKEIQPNDYNT